MASINWDALSDFEQFALLQHAPDSEYRLMGMIAAYCDESEKLLDPPVYSVTGVLGSAPEWFEVGVAWKKMLAKHHLEATGFHMAPCESGLKAPYQISRDERNYLQREFIGVINDFKLSGYTSVVEVATEFPKVQALLSGPGFDPRFVLKPYYTAFHHTVAWLAETLDRGGIPRSEPIAFVFDQQNEYEGIAKKLYDDLQRDPDVAFQHRLGSLTFDSRLNRLQLQAADVMAYEGMRHVHGTVLRGEAVRWQYQLLASVRQPSEWGYALLDIDNKR